MKVSLNWAQKLSNTDLLKKTSVTELVRKIGAQLGEVEEVINVGEPYQHIVIAKVISCQKHPNADKLSVCLIDDGGVTKNIKRNKDGLVQVVCGAPNVRQGMTVVWLPPGAIVPSTYDKERFTLEARELRGIVSNGMLASPAELAISDNHDGLLEVTEDIKPGTPFADAFDLNDTIIDIENKMFTHRPDCFGQLGVARELAGIQGKAFQSPSWYIKPQAPKPGKSNVIQGYGVTIEIGELCPRYMLIAMDSVKVGPSPVWLQTYLSRVGIRPINNVVDVTNYLMMLTGQPLHAFDFDKIAQDGVANIVVRHPRKNEQLGLLDGKTITPRQDAIVICNQDKPLALGGVMGGSNSEIDENTTRILIECANFDMYNIRRTAMEHGIFTDSVTRFNKGQSPWQCPAVLYKAVEMLQDIASAQPIGKAVDAQDKSMLKHNKPVTITADFINQRLGLNLKPTQIIKLLTNVEFEAQKKGASLVITAPFWRTDIAIPEDIVEEVGRLYGYDHLPLQLPARDLAPAPKNTSLELKKQLRNLLASAGANEVLTYSFVHGNLLQKVGQDSKAAFELSNAISPDVQFYRLSLVPSLLDKVHANIKAGFDNFALFEFGKSHNKSLKKDTEGLPIEFPSLAMVVGASDKMAQRYGGTGFYQAKAYFDYIAQTYGIEMTYEPITQTLDFQAAQPYQPGRSALVYVAGTQVPLGIIGEFKQSVIKQLKLPAFCAGLEIDLIELQRAKSQLSPYQPLSKFPKTQQDISFKVANSVTYESLIQAIQTPLTAAIIAHGYEATVEPYDLYEAEDGAQDKHITVRLTMMHFERTLTTEEVNTVLDDIAKHVKRELGATRL